MFGKNKQTLREEIQKERRIPLLLSTKESIYLRNSKFGWFIYKEIKSGITFFAGGKGSENDKSTIWDSIDRELSMNPRELLLALSTGLRLIEKEPDKADFLDEHDDDYTTCIEWLKNPESPVNA